MPFSIAGPASPAIPSLDGINRAMDRLSRGLRTDYQQQAAEAAIAGRLNSQIGENTLGIKNAINQTSALQRADQTLGQGKELVDRIQELAVQGLSNLLSETDRLAVDNEISSLISDLDNLVEEARFNGEPLFGANTVDTESLEQKISEFDGSNVSDLQTEISGLHSQLGTELNGLERAINQQFEGQIGLKSQLSPIADSDFASNVADLIKEQLLFEASVKAFDHQKMAESTIIELLN
jgi:flagellin-like hook-associated protein FlgL